jgi:hypothetical protein
LGPFILSAGRADAQSPVIIPGLPGAGLQAGARPPLTALPYSDPPGGNVATPADSPDNLQPAIPPFGITGEWLGARDTLFDSGIDLRTNVSQFYQGVTSGGLRQTLGPVAPSANKEGFEVYYNAAITRWFTLSADIQAIDPAQQDARSTFLFGLRAKTDF